MSKPVKNTRLNREARRLLLECFAAQLLFMAAILLVLAFVRGHS